MNIKYKHDIYNRTEPATIYLAKPGKKIYCALNGILIIQQNYLLLLINT